MAKKQTAPAVGNSPSLEELQAQLDAANAEKEALQTQLEQAKKIKTPVKGEPDGVKYVKEPNAKEKAAHGSGLMVKYVTREDVAQQLEQQGWKAA